MKGNIGITGSVFECEINDSLKNIKGKNPHLSDDEVQEVYEILQREIALTKKLEENEQGPTAED